MLNLDNYFTVDQESSYSMQSGWQCDFYFGYGYGIFMFLLISAFLLVFFLVKSIFRLHLH